VTPARVIDCHVHLHPAFGDTVECAEKLMRAADRLGIDLLCLSFGTFRGFYDPSDLEKVTRHNDEVQTVVERWPDRFVGFCYLNPCYLPQSLEEIERRIVGGPFRGIKLLIDMFCDQPNLDPIADRAAELGAPILQHTWIKQTGNYPLESEPRHLVALARRHPDTTFLMGHTGGNWELGIRTIIDTPNILADICGGDPELGYVEMAVRLLGADRVCYGSDALARSLASQIAKVRGADISEDDRAKILGGNMRRVLEL